MAHVEVEMADEAAFGAGFAPAAAGALISLVDALLLGQEFGKVHVGFGHRGPLWFGVEASKLHLDHTPRWPPGMTAFAAQKGHHVLGR